MTPLRPNDIRYCKSRGKLHFGGGFDCITSCRGGEGKGMQVRGMEGGAGRQVRKRVTGRIREKMRKDRRQAGEEKREDTSRIRENEGGGQARGKRERRRALYAKK